MKNYYDELEVSKTASKEVIQKVYKILAKKYHPDTTEETDKTLAEEKFKRISEAYEILSDNTKRKNYDLNLEKFNPKISYEDYMTVVKQRDELQNTIIELRNEYYKYVNKSKVNGGQYNNEKTQNSTNINFDNDTKNYSSIFDHYKQRLKEFFFNIILFFLSIWIAVFIINILF